MTENFTASESKASYSFTLGEFRCLAISDGHYPYGLDDFFTNAPAEELRAALAPGEWDTQTIISPYTCLFIDDGQHRILVDAGAGRKVGPTAGHLLSNLIAADRSPAEVDMVIITHGHLDHIGGLLDASGRPVFPNARYTIWRSELDFWQSDAAFRKAPVSWAQLARRQFFVLRERLDVIDQETEIYPGIQALAAFGHTPGHMAVSISSGDQRLLHVSDTALSPLHLAHPSWTPKYDIDPAQAAETRRRIFNLASAGENWLVFAHHFPPFPALGRVTKEGEGWLWWSVAGTANS